MDTKQGQNRAVQSFVDQLQAKDALLLQKERKLNELVQNNSLYNRERKQIEEKLKNLAANENFA